MSFECKRCGRCCKELVRPDFWTGGKLTWEQKQALLKERKKYSLNDGGCTMLYYDDKGLACCLIYVFLDESLRDKNCKEYPKAGEKCLNGLEGT